MSILARIFDTDNQNRVGKIITGVFADTNHADTPLSELIPQGETVQFYAYGETAVNRVTGYLGTVVGCARRDVYLVDVYDVHTGAWQEQEWHYDNMGLVMPVR